MHWNPYIDLRVEVSRAVRATCRQCGASIEKGTHRVEAIPVLGKPELLHLDCAAKRAPDHCARKLKDKDPDWAEVLDDLKRFVPEAVRPAPRSYQRTPILDLSWDKDAAGVKPCVFCMEPCPSIAGPSHGHAVRAFSLDGERRFHPACILQLAPGLCRRVVVENSDRWPAEVKAYFAQKIPAQVLPTPRSPWRSHTAGIPALEHSPSNRAACRYCQNKIDKDELRLAREQIYGMRRSPVYFHIACYCKSDDFHPKMIELVVLRASDEIVREDMEKLAAVLPPKAEEDDDVPTLAERLREIFDFVERKRAALADKAAAATAGKPKLTENIVDIPEGFFSS